MTQNFQTGCDSIDLSGPPWNVTRTVKLYVRQEAAGNFGLYHNEGCTKPYDYPAEMMVDPGQSTGLYFYLVGPTPVAFKFCDGLNGAPLPVEWLINDLCPATITYGKILASCLAFSMSDLSVGEVVTRHPFDLELEDGEGNRTSVLSNAAGRAVVPVDPTIVEKGEEPPGGGGMPEPPGGGR